MGFIQDTLVKCQRSRSIRAHGDLKLGARCEHITGVLPLIKVGLYGSQIIVLNLVVNQM